VDSDEGDTTATQRRTSEPYRLAAQDPRVSRAVFTLREAARHLGLPASTLHSWARGSQSGGPLITAFEARGREASVPFIGFAEAYVRSAFRRAGVPMQRIRPAVDALRHSIGIEHALASRKLYTDGAEVLYDYAVKRDDGDVPRADRRPHRPSPVQRARA
jgi:hypothetical protein